MSPRIAPNAPRFHSLLQKREGKTVFIIKRSEWERLKIEEGKLTFLNTNSLALFPFSPILMSDEYLGTVATRDSEKIKITLYRLDPKDEPTPVNVDSYTIWESIPPKHDIREMIITGDTDYNQNFQDYLTNFIFLVKDSIGDGHWLQELPEEVAILLEKNK